MQNTQLKPVYNDMGEGKTEKGKTTREKVENTLTDELIFGVCAPIGSIREPFIEEITRQLEEDYEYQVVKIKLSEFISKYVDSDLDPQLGETHDYTKLMSKIRGGDNIREGFGHSSLADLAISKIIHDRFGTKFRIDRIEQLIGDLKSRRVCYIIDSLKHKEELNLFRSVYGGMFYLFSIFSPEEERRQALSDKNLSKSEINHIINADEFENSQHGQNVRETFVEADFFLRISNENIDTLAKRVMRYLDIIFESQIITPNFDEIAMYEAKSAAGNSACLSRQVGASITDACGEVLSRGWNDVPKFGGNLYSENSIDDNRCFILGYCSNDTSKDDVSEDIVNSIIKNESFQKSFPSIKELITDDSRIKHPTYNLLVDIVRRNSKVKDLIEFSRAVHAEMHAIITGSQLSGKRMIGGKLYCTTYPCHNCARHIVVSGIKEIYFIEPYKKSLCTKLHHDSLTEKENDETKTKILMFDGVAPRRYLEFFTQRSKRKDKQGTLTKEEKNLKVPKSRLTLQAIPTLEMQSIHSLANNGLLKNSEQDEKQSD